MTADEINKAKRGRIAALLACCAFIGMAAMDIRAVDATEAYAEREPDADAALANTFDNSRPNILFVAVDDLRPELGTYEQPHIHSPNIDELAEQGTVFLRAYVQQAVCSPSRTSLLTGLRPDATGVWNLTTHFRENIPEVVTLPQHFKAHGYRSVGLGKIYHGGLDDAQSWSEPWWEPESAGGFNYLLRENIALAAKHPQGKGPAYEKADVPDNAYADGQLADRAIGKLREFARKKDSPFFLAVGFTKPHLPFNAPRKYWDLYDSEAIQLPTNSGPPKNTPDIALTNWGELRSYYGMPREGGVSDENARILKHAYYASVSYIDALVGRLLAEVDQLGLGDNTIVVLWGDHGFKLGEHGAWSKHTNFEIDTHAPLIVSVPGSAQAGRSNALVEFVDIYPTLCELAGLPKPTHLQGSSFARILEDPNIPWKKAAFSQYPRGRTMGYSMRTNRYRYNLWKVRRPWYKDLIARPLGLDIAGMELYDHLNDPGETINLADDPRYAEVLEQHQMMMSQGWKTMKPPKM